MIVTWLSDEVEGETVVELSKRDANLWHCVSTMVWHHWLLGCCLFFYSNPGKEADSGCLRGRCYKNYRLDVVRAAEHKKGTLEGTLTCFVYHRGVKESTFAAFLLYTGRGCRPPMPQDNFQPCLWPKQVFLAKTWSFPNPDQVVLVPKPNQIISTALPQHHMGNCVHIVEELLSSFLVLLSDCYSGLKNNIAATGDQ